MTDTKENKQLLLIGNNSAMTQGHLSLHGFSADNNNKKKYEKIRVSPDGMTTIRFIAPETLGVREMKNAYSMVKVCYDNRGDLFKDGTVEDKVGERVTVHINARDILKFTGERTTFERRKQLFESYTRISNMSYTVTKKALALEVDQGEKAIKRQWVYDADAKNDYEEITLEVSVAFINIVLLDGLTFNLKKMMEFKGRGTFLYAFMQKKRYEIEGSEPKRWVYWDYIDHAEIIPALDLSDLKNKREALRKAKEAFREFERRTKIKYVYNKEKNYWKKTSKKIDAKLP